MKVFSDGCIMPLRQEHSLSSEKYKERSNRMRKNKKNSFKKMSEKNYASTPCTSSRNDAVTF